MSRIKFVCLLAVVACLCQTSSVLAVGGIGIHYGFDMTLKTDDKVMEQTSFNNLTMSVAGISGLPPSIYPPGSTITGDQLPIFINRTDWKNSGINFGGKIFIDAIPFIDAVEVSTNFGVWQYNGAVIYPRLINGNPTNIPGDPLNGWANVQYDTMPINYKTLDPGHSFWGMDMTPYAKLHLDATIRKYILQIPPVIKTVKIYGGGGLNVDFATPMLSSNLIEDALGSTLNPNTPINYLQLDPILGDPTNMKKVLDEIISKMMTPHFGCHLALGAMVKLPVVPVGLYLDAKYIFLFDKLDKYVDIGGNGLLINIGAALAF